MAKNFKNGGAPDHSWVNMNEAHEVRYWMEALGCSKDELAVAVARVGNSSDAVRREVYRLGHMGQSDAMLLSHGDEDYGASEREL
jgi:Protein of unknown function (DUF3606)